MAEATKTLVMNIAKDKMWNAIMDFESYPEFVDGMKETKVLSKEGAKTQVEFFLNILSKDIRYVLTHVEEDGGSCLRWTLDDSKMFKKNEGYWTLKDLGNDQTEVTYSLNLEFSMPVPGFMLKGLIKTSLPKMMTAFESRAKNL